MRKLLPILLLLGIKLSACNCKVVSPNERMEISYLTNDIIFTGTLEDINDDFVEFNTSQFFKGEVMEKVKISKIEDCNIQLKKHQQYIVYAKKDGVNYFIDVCSSSRPISGELIPHLSNNLLGPEFFRPGIDTSLVKALFEIENKYYESEVFHDLDFLKSKKINSLEMENNSLMVWITLSLVSGILLGLFVSFKR